MTLVAEARPTVTVAVTVADVVSPAPRDEWEEIVAADPRSLADHTPAWTDAITIAGPYLDASRLYRMDDGRRFVLPLVRRRGASRLVGVEAGFPDGWGIGGLVGIGRDPSAVHAVLTELADRRAVFTRIRPDPMAGPMWAEGAPDGVVTKPRRAHVVDLSVGAEALRRGMHKSARRSLKKAEAAGLEVELDTSGRLLPAYYGLYEKSLVRWAEHSHEPLWLARWRGRRRDSLHKLQTMAACLGDRFRLWMAYKDGEPAAGSIVLLGNAAHDTRGAIDRDLAGPTRANFLLQWHSMLDAMEAGCHWYHLGESGTSAGLSTYKENVGGRACSYADYRVERLPVTRADGAVRGAVKAVIGFRDG